MGKMQRNKGKTGEREFLNGLPQPGRLQHRDQAP
jgi:hypothetical protein